MHEGRVDPAPGLPKSPPTSPVSNAQQRVATGAGFAVGNIQGDHAGRSQRLAHAAQQVDDMNVRIDDEHRGRRARGGADVGVGEEIFTRAVDLWIKVARTVASFVRKGRDQRLSSVARN